MRERLLSRPRRRKPARTGGLRALVAEGAEALRAAGESPRSEAELLLAHVLGVDRAGLIAASDSSLTAAVARDFRKLVERRTAGEPIAYLLERKGFWSLELKVTPDVLIPRPETELLVEWGTHLLVTAPPIGVRVKKSSGSCRPDDFSTLTPRVLDLGTGSGAIAVSLAREVPAASVRATDASTAALEVAKANAARLGIGNVEFCHEPFEKTLEPGLRGDGVRFELIVCNPPYVAEGDPHLADLRYEPAIALTSGPDGLRDLRAIVAGAPSRLKRGGWLLVEHGADQGAAVRALFEAAGFARVETRRDLAGHERATGGCFEQ